MNLISEGVLRRVIPPLLPVARFLPFVRSFEIPNGSNWVSVSPLFSSNIWPTWKAYNILLVDCIILNGGENTDYVQMCEPDLCSYAIMLSAYEIAADMAGAQEDAFQRC
nr:PREDICTED: uncharacterized protein LOC103979562 [Musa acuminata subsp. malaccensis]